MDILPDEQASPKAVECLALAKRKCPCDHAFPLHFGAKPLIRSNARSVSLKVANTTELLG